MKTKTTISIIVTLVLTSAVILYLVALNNRYKKIYGQDYFDVFTGKAVKAELSNPGEVVVEYPLLNSRYKIEANPDIASAK
ncbi:MAG: hypothetical protein NT014_04490 [Candidatus Omnitrophica bacterium]|nr:hypothetical protein [Candidatus Omnitrophota bacterium]